MPRLGGSHFAIQRSFRYWKLELRKDYILPTDHLSMSPEHPVVFATSPLGRGLVMKLSYRGWNPPGALLHSQKEWITGDVSNRNWKRSPMTRLNSNLLVKAEVYHLGSFLGIERSTVYKSRYPVGNFGFKRVTKGKHKICVRAHICDASA